MATPRPTPDSPAAPQRRRLHWLSWLVLLVASVVAILLEVPGFSVPPTLLQERPTMWGGNTGGGPLPDQKQAVGPHSVIEHTHGWPLTYCRRACGYGGKGWNRTYPNNNAPFILTSIQCLAPWDMKAAWSYASDSWQWNFWGLAVDLLIVVSTTSVAVAAVQIWISRRGGRIRFRVIDYLTLTAMVACFFAWRQSHVRQWNEEKDLFSKLPAAEHRNIGYRRAVRTYDGPHWLEKLWSDSRLPYCCHYSQLTLHNHEGVVMDWSRLKVFKSAEDVQVVGLLTPKVVTGLANMPRLKRLTLYGPMPLWRNPKPAPWETLPVPLSDLKKLGGLEQLEVSDGVTLIEDLESITSMPSLREIEIHPEQATKMEVDRFRRAYSHLKITRGSDQHSQDAILVLFKITDLRVKRWAWEDSRTKWSANANDGDISLIGVDLTAERIDRLREALSVCSSLEVDEHCSTEQLEKLIAAAPRLECLCADSVAASDQLLQTLLKRDLLAELNIGQGDVQVEGFAALSRLPKLYILEIYNSTFTPEDAGKLQDVVLADDNWPASYRTADDSEVIEPYYPPQKLDPFGSQE